MLYRNSLTSNTAAVSFRKQSCGLAPKTINRYCEMRNPAVQLGDDLFHYCALTAYFEVAGETGQWPPDDETVRRRACRLYERELFEETCTPSRPAEIHATPIETIIGEAHAKAPWPKWRHSPASY
jgi:hypothetical protein